MLHTGTQSFETERLICRRFEYSDADAMLNGWATDPAVQLEYGEPVYENMSQVQNLLDSYINNYDRNDFYRWAIADKTTNICIGQTAICRVYSDIAAAEIEYCISQSHWGRGYAGEALAGLIEFIFENTEFERLEAYHRKVNTRSGRVLEKSQMRITDTVERFLRQRISPDGEVFYCINRAEFLSHNAPTVLK